MWSIEMKIIESIFFGLKYLNSVKTSSLNFSTEVLSRKTLSIDFKIVFENS